MQNFIIKINFVADLEKFLQKNGILKEIQPYFSLQKPWNNCFCEKEAILSKCGRKVDSFREKLIV